MEQEEVLKKSEVEWQKKLVDPWDLNTVDMSQLVLGKLGKRQYGNRGNTECCEIIRPSASSTSHMQLLVSIDM